MELEFNEIISGRLWVGSYVREEDIPRLKHMGITAVVSLQTDEDMVAYGVAPDGLAQAYRRAEIELRRVPIEDFDREALARNLPDAVAQVADALAAPQMKVYLHCTAGVNRSATTAAGYLIRSCGISASQARSYLTSRRDCDPTLDILERFEAAQRRQSI